MAEVTFVMPPALATFPTAFSVPWTIASTPYTVEFTWDNRASENKGAWRVTWRLANGTALFSGKKLVLDFDFFEPFHYLAGVPAGRLQVFRPDGAAVDPGLNDLAGAVKFKYVTDG